MRRLEQAAALASAVILVIAALGVGLALAQPGMGGGGVDVVPGADGGANVVVQGNYTQVPSGAVNSGSPGSPGSSPAASSAPSGPPMRSVPTSNPSVNGLQNAETGGNNLWLIDQPDGTTMQCGAGRCITLSPDVGVPATPSAVDIANAVQMAIAAMQLAPPPICMTPHNGTPPPGTGLVGLWSWFFFCPEQINESNTGPVSRTAAVPGFPLVVNATAVNTSVLANWGDGSVPQLCVGVPFTPYVDAFGALPSPTCSHHLERSSELEPGGGVFRPSATSNWLVTWSVASPTGVQGGVVPIFLTSRTEIRVGEMQVLVTN